MAYAIEAHGLRKSFQTHEAVCGVNLAIRQRELFALLGPNGAGKTTTIHMLTTLLRPDEGTASICGYDVVKMPLLCADRSVSQASTPRWMSRLPAGKT